MFDVLWVITGLVIGVRVVRRVAGSGLSTLAALVPLTAVAIVEVWLYATTTPDQYELPLLVGSVAVAALAIPIWAEGFGRWHDLSGQIDATGSASGNGHGGQQ